MAKLAIREALLPGATVHQRLALARELGFAGVEFAAAQLDERVDEIDEALRAHGADPGLQSDDGNAAADYAREGGHEELAKELEAG